MPGPGYRVVLHWASGEWIQAGFNALAEFDQFGVEVQRLLRGGDSGAAGAFVWAEYGGVPLAELHRLVSVTATNVFWVVVYSVERTA